MARSPKNNRRTWTTSEKRNLVSLYKRGANIKAIGRQLGRSTAAVYKRVSVLGVVNRRG